jgi:predicted metal-dependent hydrolase
VRKKILDELRVARKKSTAKRAEESLEEIVPASVFNAEVAAWAKRIGVTPKEIRLRPLKRKWASCSSRGRLTFDTALLKQPARFRAQVIIHELLHLKVPNHGRVFRALYAVHLDL